MTLFRHTLAILVWFISAALPCAAYDNASLELVCDPFAAREWCDSHTLDPIEGVWDYPDDNVSVLIRKAPISPNIYSKRYYITVVHTPDCSLSPGETIGWLDASTEANTFRLSIFTRRSKESLTAPLGCVARLSSDCESVSVSEPSAKIKLNLFTVLPRFWRLLRISVDNPANNIPSGMIRAYPSYDRNGSSRLSPRYL